MSMAPAEDFLQKGVVSTDMFTRKKGDSAKSALSLGIITKYLLAVLAVLFLAAPLLPAQNIGIGGFDVRSTADLAIAFDYNSTGVEDHLLFYRPGTGVVYIIANVGTAGTPLTFLPVFTSVNGIGGYDLKSTADRIIAFDYDGSGKKDHLVCYRPGQGVVFILANTGGSFAPVYMSFTGMGAYPLTSTNDQIIAYDYNGSGRSDHLLLYEPGNSIAYVMENQSGTFAAVFASGTGIGGYDLKSSADRIIAFDYYGYGAADHLVVYRPGTGTVWILEQTSGSFTPVVTSTNGIGSWDLQSTADVMFAYDYNGTGLLDHLVAYRPGTGNIRIIASSYFQYAPVFIGTDGIGGYDLAVTTDQVIPVNVSGNASATELMAYRPGQGVVYILANANGVFSPEYASQ